MYSNKIVAEFSFAHTLRIGEEGVEKFLGCAGKLAQNQQSGVFSLAGNELFGHQVHAINQRRHQRDISQGPAESSVFC
jgi:hypothetical protein